MVATGDGDPPAPERRGKERRRLYNRRSGVDRRYHDEPVERERRSGSDRRARRDRRAWTEQRHPGKPTRR